MTSKLASNAVDSDDIKAASSENSRAVYRSDMEHFVAGRSLPATEQMVVACLSKMAPDYNFRT